MLKAKAQKPPAPIFRICGLLVVHLLAGCAVASVPLSEAERQQQIEEVALAVQIQPVPVLPVTFGDAVARALLFNLEQRSRAVDSAIAVAGAKLASAELLPQLEAAIRGSSRNNTAASVSRSIDTETRSSIFSTSQDKRSVDADVRVSWNLLDFGVGYFSLRQASNEALSQRERQASATNRLISEVREAYWQATAAEKVIDGIDAILPELTSALEKADELEIERLRSPLATAQFKRELYARIAQLKDIKGELVSAKFRLATLMGMRPTAPYRLSKEAGPPLPTLNVPIVDLEDRALSARPEFLAEGYQKRIDADEVHKSISRLFPGIEISFGANYSSNSYVLNNSWAQVGLGATWNLLGLVSGPQQVTLANLRADAGTLRREALGVAVLSQVNIACTEYLQAVEAYETARAILLQDRRILELRSVEAERVDFGNLDLVLVRMQETISRLDVEMAYAAAQAALGRIALAVGSDFLSGTDLDGLSVIAAEIARRDAAWLQELAGVTKSDTAATSPPGDQNYLVQRGDTLSSISKKTRVSVLAIAQANRLNSPNRILAGEVLVIPALSGSYAGRLAASGRDSVLVGEEHLLKFEDAELGELALEAPRNGGL